MLDERRRLLRHELGRLAGGPGGFLFFYISSIDQRHHMLYRHIDATHPAHPEDTPADLAGAMRDAYREIDELVGWTLDALDRDTTLIVMSDHGFAPFRRQVHLNSWLEKRGYLHLNDPNRREEYSWLAGIDWSRTRAYAIGLNSLYLNVRGREKLGIVAPEQREALARDIAAELNAWRDPESGERVVTQGVVREDVYHGAHLDDAPDIVVGYARGYRASWATTRGRVPERLIEDNDREWSGDHCMDSRAVPGVLLSSHALSAGEADLRDLTVTILEYFGVDAPGAMSGQSVF